MDLEVSDLAYSRGCSGINPRPPILAHKLLVTGGHLSVDMEVVTVDKKGRVTIPKPYREALDLAQEDELTLAVEGGELRLRPLTRKPLKVRARRRWGREAFPPSREASFGDEE